MFRMRELGLKKGRERLAQKLLGINSLGPGIIKKSIEHSL